MDHQGHLAQCLREEGLRFTLHPSSGLGRGQPWALLGAGIGVLQLEVPRATLTHPEATTSPS